VELRLSGADLGKMVEYYLNTVYLSAKVNVSTIDWLSTPGGDGEFKIIFEPVNKETGR